MVLRLSTIWARAKHAEYGKRIEYGFTQQAPASPANLNYPASPESEPRPDSELPLQQSS